MTNRMVDVHCADLLWIEGTSNAHCDWRYVNLRSDIVKTTLDLAGSPRKAYRVLAERENGYGSLIRENKDFHFEIVEKIEISL